MAGRRLAVDLQHAAQADLGPAPRRAGAGAPSVWPRRAPLPARLRADRAGRRSRAGHATAERVQTGNCDKPGPGSGDPDAGTNERPEKPCSEASLRHERHRTLASRPGERRDHLSDRSSRPLLPRRPRLVSLQGHRCRERDQSGNERKSGNEHEINDPMIRVLAIKFRERN